jgi:hypothetical protein
MLEMFDPEYIRFAPDGHQSLIGKTGLIRGHDKMHK